MKRTNKKNRNFFKRIVIKSFIGQIVLATFLGIFIYSSKPININECNDISLIVENKEYRYSYREGKCLVCSNNIKYVFPNLGYLGEYSSRELYNEIIIGEKLDVRYTTRYSMMGKYNLIVDARGEENVYIDFDFYNEQKPFILVIVFCIIAEFIYLGYIILIILNKKRIYFQKQKQ